MAFNSKRAGHRAKFETRVVHICAIPLALEYSKSVIFGSFNALVSNLVSKFTSAILTVVIKQSVKVHGPLVLYIYTRSLVDIVPRLLLSFG